MTHSDTRRYGAIVGKIRRLYAEHDASEATLVMATRRQKDFNVNQGLWAHHDALEREIILQESRLPQRLVEKLKRGEL